MFSLSDVAQAVLSVSPQSWLTEGDSVTLSCEVTGSSTGWTFSWYRAVLYRQDLQQIRDVHGDVLYHVELLSDSRREAGGSYTLSPAALNHTGVYVCRAERGEPAYQTQYSTAQTLWITGEEIQRWISIYMLYLSNTFSYVSIYQHATCVSCVCVQVHLLQPL